MITPHAYHTATLLRDGTVLVAGSYRDSSDPLASAELNDPGSGRWTATASPAAGGGLPTLLLDGRVLLTGDYDVDSQARAEPYDPGSGS